MAGANLLQSPHHSETMQKAGIPDFLIWDWLKAQHRIMEKEMNWELEPWLSFEGKKENPYKFLSNFEGNQKIPMDL